MNIPFNKYGEYYDLLYSDKDYEKECDFIEDAFRKYSRSKPRRLLEGGCGTGGHAIPLGSRGYQVVAFDASETMIRIGRKKSEKIRLKVDFHVGDLRRFDFHQKFDACICMFAVIDYLTTNRDLKSALENIRRHLRKNALFIFDFWYGPAVLSILPSPRLKTVVRNGLRIIRFAEPSLDALHHVCTVQYRLLATRENVILSETDEKHTVRFYFPEEIKHYLEENGFQLLKLCPFPDLDKDIRKDCWNVAAIARAL